MCFGYMMSISLRYQKDKVAAEDVVNRAFLKVSDNIGKYDSTLSFKPWVARITVNENIDACRRSKTLRKVINFNSDLVDGDHSLSPHEYNTASVELDADALRGLVQQLPSTTRIVFNMYVVDGYKHHEIADHLSLTTGTSKWHLNSARKRLKIMIEKLHETDKIVHYGK